MFLFMNLSCYAHTSSCIVVSRKSTHLRRTRFAGWNFQKLHLFQSNSFGNSFCIGCSFYAVCSTRCYFYTVPSAIFLPVFITFFHSHFFAIIRNLLISLSCCWCLRSSLRLVVCVASFFYFNRARFSLFEQETTILS